MLSLSHSGYGYSKHRCADVTNWFISKYMPRHKLDIHIHHRGMKRDNVYGWVWAEDCDYRPRTFEIEMRSNMREEEYIKILFHELWHIYQHVKGMLKDKYGKRLWKGVDLTEMDYELRPWEKEAQEMEDKLYSLFKVEKHRI